MTLLSNVFKLDDLTKSVTWPEWRDAITEVVGQLGISTTAWGTGAVTRTMIVGTSVMFEALSELQAEAIRGGFLEFARGPWLRIVAKYVYGVLPEPATFATGEITLVNTAGGLYEVDVGDCVVRNEVTGKTYRNMVSFELGASSSIVVTFAAAEAGIASNANAGAITELVTVLNGVEVTNVAALIARDAESPAEIRARCSEKLGSLSPMGPWDAYSYAARGAKLSTGESAGMTRSRVTRDGYGNLYLHVASASGAITGTVGDLATGIGAIDDAVGRWAEPLAVTAHVVGATPVALAISYEAWAWNTSGLDADGVRAAVAAALATYVSTHPIGGLRTDPESPFGYAYAEAIRAAIHNALPEIYRVELTTPAADAPLTASEVFVLLHNPETDATINLVARPEGTLL